MLECFVFLNVSGLLNETFQTIFSTESLPSHSSLPWVLLPSCLHHISHPFPPVHTCLYSDFIFTRTYTAWMTYCQQLPVDLYYSIPAVVGQSGGAYCSNTCQISMDLRRHFIMKTVILVPVILNLEPFRDKYVTSFSTCSVSGREKDVVQQERKTERRRAWRRSLSVCSTWYFLHFKTPELCCCQHDG